MATITDLNPGGNTLNGVAGETNEISGLDGNDTLTGAELTDVLKGGTGNDTFTGGAGADRVYLEYSAFAPNPAETDLWSDFSLTDADKIDVSDVGEYSAGSNGSLGIGEMDTILAMTNITSGAVQINWGSSVLRLATLTSLTQLGSTMFVFDLSTFADVFVLGAANDLLATNGGDDFLDGGAGGDTLFGEQGNDTVLGGQGNDYVYGGGGDDIVWGDEGNDLLSGGAGLDTINAGLGNDVIRAGAGADTVKFQYVNSTRTGYGVDAWQDYKLVEADKVDVSSLGATPTNSTQSVGVGELDTLAVFYTKTATSVTLNWGASKLTLSGATSLSAAMFKFNTSLKAEAFTLGAAADLLATGGGNDTIFGGAGADILFGEQGNDQIDGGSGGDKLYGGGGNDKLIGGLNADTIYGGAGNDILDARFKDPTATTDDLFGGTGNDTYYVDTYVATIVIVGADPILDRVNESADAGTDTVIFSGADAKSNFLAYTLPNNVEIGINVSAIPAGSGLAATFMGNALDNTLIGTKSGKNDLKGEAGNDVLFGQNQKDNFYGGSGDDTIYGLLGNDWMTGEAGKDKFVFNTALSASNVDRIISFVVADDTIVLDNAVFTKLKTAGPLGANVLRAGVKAADADDFILYDKATGDIYYDADANGANAAVKFATVDANTGLSRFDFEVI